MSQTFVLHAGDPERMRILSNCAGFLAKLPSDKSWAVEIKRKQRKRSDDQNRYLWGVVYPSIISAGGEQLRGWSAEDVHEYLLGEIYGWETLEGFGRKRLRPLRRSSKMTSAEFAEFVGEIQRRMAEIGIYVPDPNEIAA